MKKAVAYGIASLMLCSASIASAEGMWIVKGSADYFNVNIDNDMFLHGLNEKVKADTDGDMAGGTFYLGKLYGSPGKQRVTMLETSIRSGDFDYKSTRSRGNVHGKIDRDDFEIKISHTYILEKWQPYFSVGYWNIKQDISQDLQGSWYWVHERTAHRAVEKEVNALVVNVGLGYPLLNKNDFSIAFKGELGLNYAKGEYEVKTARSRYDWTQGDDSGLGYQGVAKLLFAYAVPMGENVSGQIFLDGGYQFQNFDIGEEVGEETVHGLYGRLGFSAMF